MSVTPAQPTVAKPPAGAQTKPTPGYTAVVVKPPPVTTTTGNGRGSSTVTTQPPSYTVYVPPPSVQAQLLTFKGPSGQSTFTVDPNILKNPTPVTWGGGTIGVMFDNPDTGQRNFAGFGDYTQQWANSNGRIESIMPGSPLGRYANDPQYSGFTIKATTNKPQSGNAPAWTLPQGYQVGGYTVYAANPFDPANTDTYVRETSKGNSSALGSIAEVVQDVVKTFPEWAPVVAFPLAVAVGAGALAGGLTGGSTAGLTGAGAGSSAGIAGGGLSSAGTGALTTGLTGSTVTSGLTGAAIGTGAAVPTSAAGSLGGALVGGAGGLGGASGPVGTGPVSGAGGGLGGGTTTTGAATGTGTATASTAGTGGLGYVMPGADAASSGATGGILAEQGGALSTLGGAGGAAAGSAADPTALGYIMPGAEASASGATGGILAEQSGGALAGLMGKLGIDPTSGIGGVLTKAGSGLVDWVTSNPQSALAVVGGLADLFSDKDKAPAGSLSGALGSLPAGKPLPVAPALNRTVSGFKGDPNTYEQSPSPMMHNFFGPQLTAAQAQAPAAPLSIAAGEPTGAVKRNQAVLDLLGHAAGGPIGSGALGALMPSRYYDGGPGGGQDDLLDAKVSPGEFVFDSSTVSDLGDGNNEEGARRLDLMVKNIRHQKRGGQTRLPPKAASPLSYLRG